MPDGGTLTEVTVTFFDNFGASLKAERRLSLAALCDEILKTTRPRKDDLPWLKLAVFGQERTTKNSLRHDANVIAITGVEGDYDGEELGWQLAVDLLAQAGLKAIVYTSPRHTPNKPRWRVLCPTSRAWPSVHRRKFMARLSAVFGGKFSSESWTLSQSYYYGSVDRNPDHHVELVEGMPIDLADHLDARADESETNNDHPEGGDQRQAPYDEKELLAQIISGTSYHVAKVRLAGRWARDGVAYMVARQRLVGAFETVPEDQRDDRWRHRFGDIDRCLEDIYGKDAARRDAQGDDDRTDQQDANHWPAPVDFLGDEELTGLPVLERHHVPDVLYDFSVDTAERMGVDPVSVALIGLVACASVIDEEFRLQPKQHDTTWCEEARLWAAIVGDPSILKSPVIRACTRPIDRLDAEAREAHEDAVGEFHRHLKEWEEGDKDPDTKPIPPRMSRYLVESATVEALSEVLRDDPGAKYKTPAKRVLVRQDELGEWVANFDRYRAGGKGGSDRGAYLRLYNGGRHVIDRVGRGSFAIPNWSACIMGGIQPEPIQRIAHESADDGLLQRFIYCVPGTPPTGQDRPPDQMALRRYDALIRALSALHPSASAATEDDENPSGRCDAIVLHARAQQPRQAIETLARAVASLPDTSKRLKAALGKWPGLFARVALSFHLIEIANARAQGRVAPPIGVVPLSVAVMTEQFLRDVILPHQLRAEAVMFSSVQTGHARWIAGFILARGVTRLTKRDVVQNYTALRAPERRRELLEVMESLVTVGWLLPDEASNPARDPSAWQVNPAVHTLFAARAKAERERREAARQEMAATWARMREGEAKC